MENMDEDLSVLWEDDTEESFKALLKANFPKSLFVRSATAMFGEGNWQSEGEAIVQGDPELEGLFKKYADESPTQED